MIASIKSSTKEVLLHQARLINWYDKHRRELPWRKDKNAYSIWISEVMLQQTTVAAVVPYYEKFMRKFPDLKTLAKAEEASVLEYWAGLGYYSRARNLHAAAKEMAQHGVPNSHEGLIKLPGFGPYTARAVASLAFGEKVGVLDGNVIRILSRHYGIRSEWWRPAERKKLQELADRLAQTEAASELNQGMMELGATVCTPKNPACAICPWLKTCSARAGNSQDELPLKRERRTREIWQWEPLIHKAKNKILLERNHYAPFLRGQWFLPGKVKQTKVAPKKFVARHSITHHDIFVVQPKIQVAKSSGLTSRTNPRTNSRGGSRVSSLVGPKARTPSESQIWIELENLSQYCPSSLVQKVLQLGGTRED